MTHLSLDDLGDVDAVTQHPHLVSCGACRTAVDEQLAVRDLLAALPAPAAMPADVVRALETRLRAEHRTSAATVTPIGPSRSRGALARRAPALLAAAAAAVVLVGAGGLAALRMGSADSGTATSAGAAQAEMAPRFAAPSPDVVRASGTAYTQAGLVAQVTALLAAAPAARKDATLTSGAESLADPARLRGCLQALDSPGPALAVDLATYQGTPAAVVVLPASGGGREVWVVAPDCRPGADGTRYFTRLP